MKAETGSSLYRAAMLLFSHSFHELENHVEEIFFTAAGARKDARFGGVLAALFRYILIRLLEKNIHSRKRRNTSYLG